MSLETVRRRLEAAARRAGRDPASVRLVVVTKGRSVDEIAGLFGQGQVDFGENRAQELVAKAPALPNAIRWHFVGPLQTNKVRLVRPLAHLLHSMDRLELGAAWMKGPGLPPPALVQVNIGREEQKHGVDPDEAAAAWAALARLGVPLAGVMGIPPVGERAEDARPWFQELRRIRDGIAAEHGGSVELSMGMSDDFEVAVEEGATIIRVGRAIFDPLS